MSDLAAARWLFGVSLAFHIVFSAGAIAMPVFMVAAEWRWRRTGSEVHLDLARRWAKGTAILFAVGAVSGTVISFELGLLWPRFMAFAGPIIGMPFSLEGFAFFAEAIFLGVYLYGWGRVSPRLHLAAGGFRSDTGRGDDSAAEQIAAFADRFARVDADSHAQWRSRRWWRWRPRNRLSPGCARRAGAPSPAPRRADSR